MRLPLSSIVLATIWCSISQQAGAQSVYPSNDTILLMTISNGTRFNLTIAPQNLPMSLNLIGLTKKANAQKDSLAGSLYLTTDQTVSALVRDQIAFMPCDAAAFSTSNLDANHTIAIAISKKPVAIVLYSTYAQHCTYDGSTLKGAYDLVFTALGSGPPFFERMLNTTGPTTYPATINNTTPITLSLSGNNTNATTGPSNSNLDNPYAANGTPTTAVAMIVLYSITGLITALFLVIIISGAIRAHRHPERYGPRALARFGRPPQSRARGIARAVLDSIPIVKFGDGEEEPKPPAGQNGIEMLGGSQSRGVTSSDPTDVEKAATASSELQAGPTSRQGLSRQLSRGPSNLEITRVASAGPATLKPSASHTPGAAPPASLRRSSFDDSATSSTSAIAPGPGAAPATADDASGKLACSICTEDFVRGEDIRLLPCDHRFHPDCVDPWLLNVSGTCPLCRIDLRPPEDRVANSEGDSPSSSSAQPPTDVPDINPPSSSDTARAGHATGSTFLGNPFSRSRRDTTTRSFSFSHPASDQHPLPTTTNLPASSTAEDNPQQLSARRRFSRYLEWHGIIDADRPERIAFLRRLRDQRRREEQQQQQPQTQAQQQGQGSAAPGEVLGARRATFSRSNSSSNNNRRSARLSAFLRGGRVRTVEHGSSDTPAGMGEEGA